MKSDIRKQFNTVHRRTIKRLNDIFITADLIIPILEDARQDTASSSKQTYKFQVPSTRKKRFRDIPRDKEKFLQLLDDTISYDLFKYLIVSMVTLVEDYLATFIKIIFKQYPHKLTVNIQGVSVDRTVRLDTVIDASSRQEILDSIVDGRIASLFYASPATLFEYLNHAFQFEIEGDIADSFIEIKATRDLLVHTDGIVNEVYLLKAGSMARAEIEERVLLDRQYLEDTLRVCKRLIGIVRREGIRVYCKQPSDQNKIADTAG
jgi:hypothetical protein